MGGALRAASGALADAVDTARAGLVQIRLGNESVGAGIVWSSDGLLITNAHVVGGRQRRRRRMRVVAAPPRVVLPDGKELAATVVAVAPEKDLAALRVTAGEDLLPLVRGDARALRPGAWVVAVGHPWGVRGAATAGAVIDVGRAPTLPYDGDLIQMGLQLRPGHSGGALVDGAGRLLGINTMISGPQVGLAIPEYVVARFLAETVYQATLV